MPPRRIDLPPTLSECHQLILELYELIDELQARGAQLERELHGPRRERFISDNIASDDDSLDGNDESLPVDGDHTGNRDIPADEGDEPVEILPRKDDVDTVDQSPADSPAALSPVGGESKPSMPESGIESTNPPGSPPSGPQPVNATPEATKRNSTGRRARVYPPDTPRVQVYHGLDESTVPPEILRHPLARRFYRLVREEVELPQRQIRVIEHYQEVIAVDGPDQISSSMFVAPVPEPLLERCYAGNSLLAYVAVSRFSDHLPYYRGEDIIRREGLAIARSTQWRWMRGLAQLVAPLVRLIRRRLLASQVLGIDETPCPILDPSLPHTRSAYLYAQYGDDSQPYVGYYFADHKTRRNIESMLDGYQGVLQSDAYVCYELITAASLDQIQPAACWAHGRRKFEPLVVPGKPSKANWILHQIQRLYDIEDRARTLTAVDRLALRQAESKPIVEGIYTWLKERQEQERPRAAIRKAANYFLKRWDAFTRFLDNGSIRIDNNLTEAAIKGPVMGKKAWLFLGNAAAGETAAIMYTLIMSCKRHCIDPHAYLLDVMARVKTANTEELESLLPDRWIKSHPEAYVPQRAQESASAAYRKRTRRHARRRQFAGA